MDFAAVWQFSEWLGGNTFLAWKIRPTGVHLSCLWTMPSIASFHYEVFDNANSSNLHSWSLWGLPGAGCRIKWKWWMHLANEEKSELSEKKNHNIPFPWITNYFNHSFKCPDRPLHSTLSIPFAATPCVVSVVALAYCSFSHPSLTPSPFAVIQTSIQKQHFTLHSLSFEYLSFLSSLWVAVKCTVTL